MSSIDADVDDNDEVVEARRHVDVEVLVLKFFRCRRNGFAYFEVGAPATSFPDTTA